MDDVKHPLLPYIQKRSGSRSPSPRRSRTDDDIQESRSHSKSSKFREHKEGHRVIKNYSRSRSHSITRSRKSYRSSKYEGRRGGSRSRSRSPYRGRVSRSRSRSYSRSRYSRDRNMYRSHSRSPMSSRRRHVGNRDNPCPGRCLGVFGLSICTSEQQLYHIFSKYGPVERVVVVIDAKTKRPKGFCFVYFESLEDAKVAKEQCSGMDIDGRRIRVDYSITERAHTPTPGIYIGKPTHLYDSRGGGGSSGGGGWDGPRRRDYNNRGSYRRSPSPYYSNRRRSRYERSRSRSYTPRFESRGVG
ncbi:PREDICTED: transformer-2 protein homolog alpha isoform X2 [Ceratosolen solmsi marchali]|uniref:Transformer-2 protein homolog alpha isoform X2 n=1 Tax=Ceratosolen solmsi marchali TaxID=326594 RepID=A0AAJ7DY30_9HYME|nr:PREDICTED: transformer-2 protein homolog alpha isoform X2 [Ceratosolen solmsi marchali]